MRALVAFNGQVPPALEWRLKKEGIVPDVVSYNHPDDVLGDLEHVGGAPYSFLLHDDGLSNDQLPKEIAALKIPSLSNDFKHAAHEGRFHLNDFMREVYLALSEHIQHSKDGIITAGPFEVNLLEGTAKVNDKPLNLTPKEYTILRALCIHGIERPVTTNELYEHVYGVNSDVSLVTISVLLSYLNEKIRKVSGEDFCIRQQGHKEYRLTDELNDFERITKGLKFSKSTGILKSKDKQASLPTGYARDIMNLLADAKGRVLKKDFICKSLNISNGSLDVYLSCIRKVMREVSDHHYIVNIKGQGFRLSQTPVPDKPNAKRKAPACQK